MCFFHKLNKNKKLGSDVFFLIFYDNSLAFLI